VSDLSTIPIVRLTLERMEVNLLAALSTYEVSLSEEVRHAVEKFCQPENIQYVVDSAVAQSLERMIRLEVDRFYRDGPGASVIREGILARLGEREP
jgi:hypothetical protein